MQMLMEIEVPNEPFNTMLKKGTVGDVLQGVVADSKPSAVYFSERDGRRGGILVVDVPDASRIPALAEPWFVLFDATVKFSVCLTPEDLGKAGLDEIGRKLSGAA